MRLYTCDRCGKKMTSEEVNRIGILKGDIDLMSLLDDNPNIDSLVEVMTSFLDPNSKIYCDDCINSIKQFIDSTAVVRVNSSKNKSTDAAKPVNDNTKPTGAKSVENKKPKTFTFEIVGEPEIHFKEPSIEVGEPEIHFKEPSIEDLAKKLFGI